jgi:hypothetical protein
MGRVVVAFAAFALGYPLAAFVLRGAFGPAGALTVAGVTIAATLVLGVPAFVLLCRRGWMRWWHFACGGAGIGALCVLPFGIGGSALVGALAPSFVVLGAAHGALFWVLTVWRNAGLAARCPTRESQAS